MHARQLSILFVVTSTPNDEMLLDCGALVPFFSLVAFLGPCALTLGFDGCARQEVIAFMTRVRAELTKSYTPYRSRYAVTGEERLRRLWQIHAGRLADLRNHFGFHAALPEVYSVAEFAERCFTLAYGLCMLRSNAPPWWIVPSGGRQRMSRDFLALCLDGAFAASLEGSFVMIVHARPDSGHHPVHDMLIPRDFVAYSS